MALLTFFIVTLISSGVLTVWSVLLLKNYKNKRKKIIEGRKTLLVYVVLGIAGMVFSSILIVVSILSGGI